MPPAVIGDQILNEYSYLILPYCRNGTLKDLILKAREKNDTLPIGLVLYICKQVILAVHTLRKLGNLAHCDIKPENLVLTKGFLLALIDFGHLELLDSMLEHETGTVGY